MAVGLPAGHEPLVGPLACKQSCCQGGQLHGPRHTSQFGGYLSTYITGQWLLVAKLPLHCDRVAACVVQFRMWQWGTGAQSAIHDCLVFIDIK